MRFKFAPMLLFVLLVLLIPPAAAQSRSVFWEEWNVTIFDVDTTNNSFRVREDYRIQFDGTFRFGTVEIPSDNLEDIRNVVVYENGQPLREACSEQPGTYCSISQFDGLALEYYFSQPITNAVGVYAIEYTVVGALRVYEGGDQLWWIAVPEEKFGFSVGSSTITVELPAGYGPREGIDPVETYGATGSIRVNGSRVVATATERIDASQAFELRVQYPHNPNARVASWQAEFDDREAFEETVKPLIDLALIGLGLLVASGGPLGVYALWYSRGRDPKVGLVPTYLSEPPGDLPPAVVGTLIDEKADTRDVLCTIIDLADRGYLVLQEDKHSGLFGLGGGSEFTFKRTDKPLTDLRGFEQEIIEKVFLGRLERSMDDLKYKFYKYMPSLRDDLYDELVTAELFTAKPSTTRAAYSSLGGLILLIAGGMGFLAFGAMEDFTQTLICVPIALGLTGVAMMIVGNHMPRKTRDGAEEAAKWDAFKEYLTNLEKYDQIEAKADIFSKYLPYAVAFGLDRSWIRRFAKVNHVGVPTWYYPTYRGGQYSRGYRAGTPLPTSSGAGNVLRGDVARAGGGGFNVETMASDISGGLESMSSGLSNMLESASRVLTSQPQSSGSSGRWSSGGSSWSGGGFSGGGGSGGGSRGFG